MTSEWISVKERLPEKCVRVFASWPNGYMTVTTRHPGMWWSEYDHMRLVEPPSHWMPLPPEPPKEEKEE